MTTLDITTGDWFQYKDKTYVTIEVDENALTTICISDKNKYYFCLQNPVKIKYLTSLTITQKSFYCAISKANTYSVFALPRNR